MRALFILIIVSVVGATAWAENHTNALLKATFALTAYIQENTNGPVWTVTTRKFGNTDIIDAVTTDAGLPPSDFTSNSLILLSENVLTNHHLAFNLRSGSGADTDISSTGTTNLDISLPNAIVTSIRPAPQGRTTNSTDLTIFEFVLNTTNASFDVKGPATLTSTSIILDGKVVDRYPFTSALTVSLSGGGTVNGKNAVFNGTFRAYSRKIEVKTTP